MDRGTATYGHPCPSADPLDIAVSGIEPTVGATHPDGGAASQVPRLPSGRYAFIDELGQGGMGRVFRAYDSKLQREVAIKELHQSRMQPGHDDRLIAEARAMARLSHPNAVRVYDVEIATDGRVLVVMEFVRGQTLGEWLENHRHDYRRIVATFCAAAQGLSAAHQAGLLHRDFKPANVLMGLDGSIKVTDFGLAKHSVLPSGTMPIDSAVTGPTGASGPMAAAPPTLAQGVGLTLAGQVVGTPRYMAPEQHDGSALTPAVDQYALCVALWEALCGEPPFEGHNCGAAKHLGPPAWPNVPVPGRIRRAITRGLSVEPALRWPSLDALVEALLAENRAPKRWAMSLTGLGLATVAGVGIHALTVSASERCSGASMEIAQVWNEQHRSELEHTLGSARSAYASGVLIRTEQALDDYAERWIATHRESCVATAKREEKTSEAMDRTMVCLQRVKVEMGTAVEALVDADPETMRRAHEIVGGLRAPEGCASPGELGDADQEPVPAMAPRVDEIRRLLAEARIESTAGQHREARDKISAAEDVANGVGFPLVHLEILLAKGNNRNHLGDHDEAEQAFRAALRTATELHLRERAAQAAASLVWVVGVRQQRIAQGVAYSLMAEGLSRGVPHLAARAVDNRASLYDVQGMYAQAEHDHRLALALWESATGPGTEAATRSRVRLALTLSKLDRDDEAEAEFRRALADTSATLGPEHPDVGSVHVNIGIVLYENGRYEAAQGEYRQGIAILIAALGDGHPDVARARSNLGNALYAQQHYGEAAQHLRAAMAGLEARYGSEHLDVVTARANLAGVYLVDGRPAKAEQEYREVLRVRIKMLGDEHPEVAAVYNNVGSALHEQGKRVEAMGVFRRAVERFETTLGAGNARTELARDNLAAVLFELGRLDEAETLSRRVLSARQKVLPSDHHHVAQTRARLARILAAQARSGVGHPRSR